MKNKTKRNGTSTRVSEPKPGKKSGIVTILRQIKSHLAKGVELSQMIVEKLESIDVSITLFVAQKARELSPCEADTNTAP